MLSSSQEAYTALQQLIADLQEQTVLTGILADIDALQNGKLDKTGDSKDNTVTFAEASTDTNIASGETHTTLFGKLLKNIKTLRSLIGTLANLTTTEKSNLVGAINEIAGQYGKKIDINNSGYEQNTRGLRTVTNANINEVAHTGDYYCVGCTNRPVEVNGILEVKAQDYDTIWQVYTPYTSEIIYTRKKVPGSGWLAWKKITPVAL
ncbi:pyocin knob domain-containing protein [Anaerosacchariphilus polymeriproducens]|uniref:pyocin knob domain-containing protein n=1 Tax=Anaerosacchariphilus polymeriproducens TaxID=1812858 RepID=UPI00139055CE|nr:pyocin knob domain-containing protein [Anaerosacchariphilus polymeriproducens]